MTREQIIATILSPPFAAACTSLLRRICPALDGLIVWAMVLAITIGGNVLGYYGAAIPPIVWVILAPVVGAVLVIGGVQTAQRIADRTRR